MTTTIISLPSSTLPQSSSSTISSATIITTPSSPPFPSYIAAIPSWIMDSFVFDEYIRKVSQVSQFVVESKFIEATQKLVEYGNREFLRSFQLRSEIREGSGNGGNGNSRNSSDNSNNNNDNNNIITTDVASLIPPFETIGFLEGKWLEVLRELVDYGNKNILGNFTLYLVMEERRVEEQYVKEVGSGILGIKAEEITLTLYGYLW